MPRRRGSNSKRNNNMNIANLLQKPLWQMTGEEFMYLSQNVGKDTEAKEPMTNTMEDRKSVV